MDHITWLFSRGENSRSAYDMSNRHAVGKPFMFFTQTNRSRCNNKQLPHVEHDFGNSGSLTECIFLLKYKLFNNDGLHGLYGVYYTDLQI